MLQRGSKLCSGPDEQSNVGLLLEGVSCWTEKSVDVASGVSMLPCVEWLKYSMQVAFATQHSPLRLQLSRAGHLEIPGICAARR